MKRKKMVWIAIFCIIICEIQMIILRGPMPTEHLALGRPSKFWDIETKSCLGILPQGLQSRKSQRQKTQSLFFFLETCYRDQTNTQARSGGQKGKWKQAHKWIEMWTDRYASGLISSPWMSLVPYCAYTRDGHILCLNGSKLTLHNASICKWL